MFVHTESNAHWTHFCHLFYCEIFGLKLKILEVGCALTVSSGYFLRVMWSSSIGQSFTPVRSMFMSLNSSKIYCTLEA